MKKWWLIGCVALVAAASAAAWYYPVWRAQSLVAAQMFDPESAKFKSVRAVDGGAICGFVNAKNRYGAYVGFAEFAVEAQGKVLLVPTTELSTSMAGKSLTEMESSISLMEKRVALLERVASLCAQKTPEAA